jgi:hypothetical protein
MFWNKKRQVLTCYACGTEMHHPSDRIRKHMMEYHFSVESIPIYKPGKLYFDIYLMYCDDCFRVKRS